MFSAVILKSGSKTLKIDSILQHSYRETDAFYFTETCEMRQFLVPLEGMLRTASFNFFLHFKIMISF